MFEKIILNQFGRRNISSYQRAILALKLESVFSQKAKQKQIEAGGALRLKSTKAEVNTNKELAKIAGLGKDTIQKVKAIESKA